VDFRPIKPDMVKYEMRMVRGEDPFMKHQKKPGGFGRFLSGIGKFFGAVAMPLSFIFPPAMIGALGAYGLGQIGDQMQYKSYMKVAQQQATQQGTNVSFPGMSGVMGGGPGGGQLSSVQADILNVLYSRNDMMMDSAHQI